MRFDSASGFRRKTVYDNTIEEIARIANGVTDSCC